MNNFLILKPAYFFFLLCFFYGNAFAVSEPPYTPINPIFINCGSSDNNILIDGRNWTSDLNPNFGFIEQPDNKSTTAKASFQDSSVMDVPYMTARISRSQFTYSFLVTPGQKFIRLYFYPASYQGGFNRSNDRFDVKIGPYTLLWNFSASLYADDWRVQTYFREFCINVDEHQQQLNITFASNLVDSNESYVFINGIEIMPMPTHLYYTPSDGPGIKFLGQNRTLTVQNDTALSMVCRLNAGGSFISPSDDTGMYRSWNDDIFYMFSESVILGRPGDSLNYSKIQAYIAPDNVYKSSRSMGEGTNNNLTWEVPVHPGYRYLVRLHFCEFFSEVKINERRFDIFINNLMAEEGLDVIESSGGNLIPIYKDYIVQAGKQGETTDYPLHITIRPNALSEFPDSFLNGMEIFGLNSTDGNLARRSSPSAIPPPPPPLPVLQPLPTKKSDRIRTLLIAIFGSVSGLLVILCLFCFVFFWRMRKRKKHNGTI